MFISQTLTLPLIVAPMFLVSGPKLVCACREAGIVGSFPTANVRTTEQLDEWLHEICNGNSDIPFAANVVVHKTNLRAQADLEVIVKYKVPIVITSVGSPRSVIADVHGYGGKVIADVASVHHAKKAVEAGVDGLILLCAGAGGHTGWLNPFAFVPEVRKFFQGPLILAGAISDGRAIAAALQLGANFVYMGTRFIAATESMAQDEYRNLLIECNADDIVTTKEVTGLVANFLQPSLEAAGYIRRKSTMSTAPDWNVGEHFTDAVRWKDIWSSGHGVGAITEKAAVRDIVSQLSKEFCATVETCHK